MGDAQVPDARTLDVHRDETGVRSRPFADAVRHFAEQAFEDWGLAGPRTLRYCYKGIARSCVGPRVRLDKYKAENKIGDSDFGWDVLDLIVDVVETAVAKLQLDTSNLESFEKLERKRQYVEGGLPAALGRGQAQQGRGEKAWVGDRRCLLRCTEAGRGSVISPELLAFVSRRTQEESEITCQRRKAYEARALAAPKKGASSK